jgi:hypothetical protein
LAARNFARDRVASHSGGGADKASLAGAGAPNQTVFNTDARPLNVHGDALFSGHLNGAPTTACGNPIFLIRIAAPMGAAGRWIATGADRSIVDEDIP